MGPLCSSPALVKYVSQVIHNSFLLQVHKFEFHDCSLKNVESRQPKLVISNVNRKQCVQSKKMFQHIKAAISMHIQVFTFEKRQEKHPWQNINSTWFRRSATCLHKTYPCTAPFLHALHSRTCQGRRRMPVNACSLAPPPTISLLADLWACCRKGKNTTPGIQTRGVWYALS